MLAPCGPMDPAILFCSPTREEGSVSSRGAPSRDEFLGYAPPQHPASPSRGILNDSFKTKESLSPCTILAPPPSTGEDSPSLIDGHRRSRGGRRKQRKYRATALDQTENSVHHFKLAMFFQQFEKKTGPQFTQESIDQELWDLLQENPSTSTAFLIVQHQAVIRSLLENQEKDLISIICQFLEERFAQIAIIPLAWVKPVVMQYDKEYDRRWDTTPLHEQIEVTIAKFLRHYTKYIQEPHKIEECLYALCMNQNRTLNDFTSRCLKEFSDKSSAKDFFSSLPFILYDHEGLSSIHRSIASERLPFLLNLMTRRISFLYETKRGEHGLAFILERTEGVSWLKHPTLMQVLILCSFSFSLFTKDLIRKILFQMYHEYLPNLSWLLYRVTNWISQSTGCSTCQTLAKSLSKGLQASHAEGFAPLYKVLHAPIQPIDELYQLLQRPHIVCSQSTQERLLRPLQKHAVFCIYEESVHILHSISSLQQIFSYIKDLEARKVEWDSQIDVLKNIAEKILLLHPECTNNLHYLDRLSASNLAYCTLKPAQAKKYQKRHPFATSISSYMYTYAHTQDLQGLGGSILSLSCLKLRMACIFQAISQNEALYATYEVFQYLNDDEALQKPSKMKFLMHWIHWLKTQDPWSIDLFTN